MVSLSDKAKKVGRRVGDEMMWPRKMYLITFHMGNSHLSCAEHLILKSP